MPVGRKFSMCTDFRHRPDSSNMTWSWSVLKQQQAAEFTADKFWSAVNVWNTKPHLLIKHLIGAIRLVSGSFAEDSSKLFDLLAEQPASLAENPSETFQKLGLCNGDDVQVEVWKLLTKKPVEWNDYLRLSVFDKRKHTAVFYDFTPKNGNSMEKYAYGIHFANDQLELCFAVPKNQCKDEKTLHWLTDVFFPKFVNWAINNKGSKPTVSSLSHICVKKYCHLYNWMKEKYAASLIEVWTEVTDPKKYVHKDIATATYLMLLWADTKPSFVDMGCGNGLLVYILNSEGYKGIGLDVRSRKMWDQYPLTTVLKVTSVDPSSPECKFPKADWIIGNHSDELSPWVPVIASRSNYNCNFFLLPCCPFEFNGSRYQRQDSSVSQYHDYLKYIEKISINVFKFHVKVDRLRIPSTKRTCIIGWSKNYLPQEMDKVLQDVESYANSKFNKNVQFVPRPPEERVRNCTKLDKDLVSSVVDSVASFLIKRGDGWKCRITLGELAKHIDDERLKKLKKECGGLQTLLKNHRYIFIVEKGTVGFRKPVKDSGKVWKKHMCWFYHNYPDKCPLNEDECCNIH
ncbi:tRNA (uracil-O(2)-)-methyltransferase [Cinara cedri]|uniref:tRNA (uracil-O(2)-)-methyltransferase n=1 Tax=Cinara cedri TaxID=506608 RepID=A0A5E4MX30_9HEMI|nr:tRNA (uracil-O(2)-)-methyltransferase [Cinara cedri]